MNGIGFLPKLPKGFIGISGLALGAAALIALASNALNIANLLHRPAELQGVFGMRYPYASNIEMVGFLDRHDGQTVQLDIVLDAGFWGFGPVAYTDDVCSAEADIPADDYFDRLYLDGAITNKTLPLPIAVGTDAADDFIIVNSYDDVECMRYAIRIASARPRFEFSRGGSDVYSLLVRGLFRVTVTHPSSMTTEFVLEELPPR